MAPAASVAGALFFDRVLCRADACPSQFEAAGIDRPHTSMTEAPPTPIPEVNTTHARPFLLITSPRGHTPWSLHALDL